MNRLAIALFAALTGMLLVSACGPLPSSQGDPAVAQATFVQQTMEALPTLTLPPTNTAVPPTATLPPTRTPTQTPTVTTTAATSTVTATGTTAASATATTTGAATSVGTGTAVATFTMTVTGTPPTQGPVTATTTGTLAARWYGTQPPNIDYGTIALVNTSKAQVYVSFQCTTPEGYSVIDEYPVGGSYMKVQIAAGRCVYVAWVGGRKFEGTFGLGRFEDLTMTFKKDSVTIR